MPKNSYAAVSAFFKLRAMLALLLCVVGTSIGVFTFAAPTPSSSGTISSVNPKLTYSDGPFVVSNATAQAGPPVCTAPMSCSDFVLTVAVSDATKQIRVSVGWPVSTADFDLYVYSGSGGTGGLVASSATSSDPEVVILPAQNAVYTVRVVPFAPAGQTYTANISLETKPAIPAAGTAPAARYQDYPPSPATLAGAGSAGEPSIGVDWNPNVASLKNSTPDVPSTPPTGGILRGIRLNTAGVAFFTANLNEYRVNFDDCSSPAENLWEDVTNATESVTTLDPIGFVDHQLPGETGAAANGAGLGRVFQSQLAGATSITSFSSLDGQPGSYSQSQGSGQPAGVDHQTLGGGPYAPTNSSSLPPVVEPPHPLYPHQIYYASQDIGTAFAARSDDGGQTFNAGVPMYNVTQCGGLHGHLKVGPDGTVYVPNKSCGSTSAVAVSRDNGVTWTVKPIVDSGSGFRSTPGSSDPSVGIGADNTLYVGYQNGDGHAHIAVSTNHGDTFHDVDVSQGVVEHCVFPEVVAGDGDRAAFGFVGTNGTGSPDDTANFTGVWYFYVATTIDRGQTYTLVDATNGDPVQVGSVCTAGTTCGADRNLLDFADIQIDKEGRVLVAYADGCVAPTCTAASAAAHSPPYNESRSAQATVIRQSGGPRLLSAHDADANCSGSPLVCAATVPGAPRVDSVVLTGSLVHLAWSVPDNGGSGIIGYKVYRKTGTSGTYALLATVTGGKTTYDDSSITDPNAQYFYKVTAINAVGEGAACGQFPVGQAGIAESPCLPPGLTILTDKTGDELDMVAGHDVQSLQISEPFAIAPNKVMFTLKMQSLATVPPNTQWPVVFNGPDGVNYTVRMTNSPADGATTAPIFQVGPTAGTLVPADSTSNFTPDGNIRIIVPQNAIGVTATAQKLSQFLVRIAVNGARITATPDNMPDNVAPAGTYTIVGNASCAPKTPPVAALTANPPSGAPPLAVSFDASGSSDADAGVTIASYSFDFGDGTAPATRATPVVAHTYQSNGHYKATVRVTDSRGVASNNVASAEIEVELPLDGVVSEQNHGGTAFSVVLYDPALYPDGTGQVECRREGAGYNIIYTFGSEFTTTGAASSVTVNNGGTVARHGPGPGANQYQLLLTGVTNAQRHTITINGLPVYNSNNQGNATLNNVIARLDLLQGDTNNDRAVNSADIAQTKSQSGRIVTKSNFRQDVTHDGAINSADVSLVKSKSGTALP